MVDFTDSTGATMSEEDMTEQIDWWHMKKMDPRILVSVVPGHDYTSTGHETSASEPCPHNNASLLDQTVTVLHFDIYENSGLYSLYNLRKLAPLKLIQDLVVYELLSFKYFRWNNNIWGVSGEQNG